jgi:hypothetical protein
MKFSKIAIDTHTFEKLSLVAESRGETVEQLISKYAKKLKPNINYKKSTNLKAFL